MPDKLVVAECRLRDAMSDHYKEHGSQPSYRKIYENLPTEFGNMSHKQILEVADIIFESAVMKRDVISKTTLQPLITSSKVLLTETNTNIYIANLGKKENELTMEDIKNALLYGKYQL